MSLHNVQSQLTQAKRVGTEGFGLPVATDEFLSSHTYLLFDFHHLIILNYELYAEGCRVDQASKVGSPPWRPSAYVLPSFVVLCESVKYSASKASSATCRCALWNGLLMPALQLLQLPVTSKLPKISVVYTNLTLDNNWGAKHEEWTVKAPKRILTEQKGSAATWKITKTP